jgi:hypothetical protein
LDSESTPATTGPEAVCKVAKRTTKLPLPQLQFWLGRHDVMERV